MKIKLEKDFFFEAAHKLPNVPPEHKCARLHGHSYKAQIMIEGDIDPVSGWFMDHSELSAIAKPIIDGELDHRYLNDIPGLENPTFENISQWLWSRLKPQLPGLTRITLHETPTSRCIFEGPR